MELIRYHKISEPRDGHGQQREGGARGWEAGTCQQVEEAAAIRGKIPIVSIMLGLSPLLLSQQSESNHAEGIAIGITIP